MSSKTRKTTKETEVPPTKKKTKKTAKLFIEDELPPIIEQEQPPEDDSWSLTLTDINTTAIDKQYAISDILEKKPVHSTPEELEPKKKVKSTTKSTIDKKKQKDQPILKDELISVSTSLEKLGISTTRKDPAYLMYWGEQYKIRLFVSSSAINELTPTHKVKCFNCHQYAPEGALMLAVPWRYVPSYIERHDYSPEWINVVPSIKVERTIRSSAEAKMAEGKQNQRKVPKTTYLKHDLPNFEYTNRINEGADLTAQDYFDTENPVCSFNCMVTEGHRLRDKDHNPRFRNVDMYIAMLYQKIFGSIPPKIRPASKFSILQEYGGNYTLEEYRKEFTFATLEETGQVFTKVKSLINPAMSLLRSG
jgi:hypothetical protein